MKKVKSTVQVKALGGLEGTAELPPHGWHDQDIVRVRLTGGEELFVPAERLLLLPDGTYFLDFKPGEIDRYRTPDSSRAASSDAAVIPVVEETMTVEKRPVETGRVVVSKTVREVSETVDPPLMREQVRVERVPVNRVIDAPVATRQEGDVTIIPVMEEELVVEKRLVLREEIHLVRERTETRQPTEILLRKEEARVERIENPPERHRKRA